MMAVGRRFVGEQAGVIYVVTADGERLETPFLDLRDRMVTLLEGFDQRGLLGLAFHRLTSWNWVRTSSPVPSSWPVAL